MSCLSRLGPTSRAARLLCLPHAGASGDAYASWPRDLAGALEVWAVTPAGRRSRSAEPLNEDPARLVGEVVAEVMALDERPLIVFGHSMGALIGYEVALALASEGRTPRALAVSGCAPPHVRTARPARQYSDIELADTLVDWGGTDPELVNDPQLRQLLLPPLRADLRLCDRYRRVQPHRLPVPLWALAGRRDQITPAAQMQEWAAYSTDFRGVITFRGGHFFATEQRRRVVDQVASLAMDALTSPSR